jgi:hypothetical protein
MVINKAFPCKWMVRADGDVPPRIWARLGVHVSQYVGRETVVEIEEVVRMQLGKITATISPVRNTHNTGPMVTHIVQNTLEPSTR